MRFISRQSHRHLFFDFVLRVKRTIGDAIMYSLGQVCQNKHFNILKHVILHFGEHQSVGVSIVILPLHIGSDRIESITKDTLISSPISIEDNIHHLTRIVNKDNIEGFDDRIIRRRTNHTFCKEFLRQMNGKALRRLIVHALTRHERGDTEQTS